MAGDMKRADSPVKVCSCLRLKPLLRASIYQIERAPILQRPQQISICYPQAPHGLLSISKCNTRDARVRTYACDSARCIP